MKSKYMLLMLAVAFSCSRESLPKENAQVCFSLCPPEAFTKAQDPDEVLISDYNLLIYNCFGMLEEKVYVSSRAMEPQVQPQHATILLKDVPYIVLAAANLGYELPLMNLKEALSYRFHLAYPDEFGTGMPMAACLWEFTPHGNATVSVPLERLMARIDVNIDRTALDGDVRFEVTDIRIGGCASSALLFGTSKAENKEQIFLQGYLKEGHQVDALGKDAAPGISEPVSLYLLENCQGDLLENVDSDSGKVFADATYRDICSFIEIHANYHSDSWETAPGERLIYRFYLGEDRNNFDVVRNCLYKVTVRPEGSGLSEDSWRVDKGGLKPKTRMELHPAAYNECASGEDFHIWCEITPKGTPVTIEPLAYDDDPRVTALYDYTVDQDGCGLTIHTRKGGWILVSFAAGEPVNRDTLAMLVVDP